MKIRKMLGLLTAAALACTALFTGCGGIRADAVLVTINGGKDTISLGYGNFVARYTQSLYDAAYRSYYGTDFWSREEEGETFADRVKEEVLDAIEEEYLLNLHAGDYDISLSEEDEKEIKKAAKKFISDNSQETLDAMNATEETVTEFLKKTTIAGRVEDAVKAEVEVNVKEEDAAQRTFTYAYFNSMTYQDANGNTGYYTDDQKEELKKKAEALTSAVDLKAEGEAAGASVQTYSYGGDGEESMNQTVLEAADALAEGELSPVISVDGDGYYVLRLDSAYDEEATAEKMKSMEEEQRNEYLTKKVKKWKKDVDWKVDKKQWEKVRFDSFFQVKTGQEEEAD